MAEAVSVHVYSPPLEKMTFFDPTVGGALQATRTERYDTDERGGRDPSDRSFVVRTPGARPFEPRLHVGR